MASVVEVRRSRPPASTDPASLPDNLFQRVLDAVYTSSWNSWKKSEDRSYGFYGTNFNAALVSKKWHMASTRALTVARVSPEAKKEADVLKQLALFKSLTKIVLYDDYSLSEEFVDCATENWPGLRTLVLQNGRFLPERLGKSANLPESMGDLVGLQELIVDNSHITALPHTLSKLTALRKLKWKVTDMDTSIIANLVGLHYLFLKMDDNTLQYKAPVDLFAGLKQLQVLKLRTHVCYTAATPVLQSLVHCTDLRKLKLFGCEGLLEDLSWLPELAALRNFEVASEWVPKLPANIGALKNLERLCVEKGEFKTLPQSFGKVTSLRNLSIESSALEKLPKSMAKLTQLTELSLSGGKKFKVAFMNLSAITSLKTLSIYGCRFIGIPEDLGFLPNLTSLVICCKPCNSLLPHGFPSLQTLEVNGCLWPNSPGLVANSEAVQLTVEDYPCLKLLKINYWEAEPLPDALGHLHHLEELRFHSGDFTQLPETLTSLSNFKELHVHHCKKLASVPATLGTISSLVKLCLNDCENFDHDSLTPHLKKMKRACWFPRAWLTG